MSIALMLITHVPFAETERIGREELKWSIASQDETQEARQ